MNFLYHFRYFIFSLSIFVWIGSPLLGNAQYYCTAADKTYARRLVNLIGSIHKHNFNELKEIAVFDLGLTRSQVKFLNKIAKVKVYKIRDCNPDLLKIFYDPTKPRLGWYAWKPVCISQILEQFPYVLWLDAGCEVHRPLDDLFAYIQEKGYFLCLTGGLSHLTDQNGEKNVEHSIGWRCTSFVAGKCGLNSQENRWILGQESVMAGFVGLSKTSQNLFLNDWVEMTKDIRYFADDGTAPGGISRHDQTLLSILAHKRKLHLFPLDAWSKNPIILYFNNQQHPFYMNCFEDQSPHIHVLIQAGSQRFYDAYLAGIVWRKKGE